MSVYEGRPLVMEMESTKEDFEETNGYGCGCGWFQIFTSKWWQRRNEEGKHLLDERGEGYTRGEETWVMEKLRNMKETSEVIAGPKWKKFLRKISGYGKKQQKNRFQYDEHSYALNFNSGAQSEDEEYFPPSFSTRFSNPFPAARHQNET